MNRSLLLALSLAAAPLAAQTPPVPVGDYHLHLVSPAVVVLAAPSHLPAVDVPAELARVLRERERIVGTSAVTDLFTEDAQMVDLNSAETKWVRGREAIRAAIAAGNPGYRLVPNAYAIHGDAAWIAANTVRGEEVSLRYTSNVLFALEKGPDGKWRIAVESASLKPPPLFASPFDADSLVKLLDAAGIRRGVVLSLAYLFASPFFPTTPDEQERVRAENDWTAAQVARYPDRLVGFCSVNPLKDYAIQEIERCARLPRMRGLKLHFANSGVNVLNP
ncbi:MAG TPA: amidohydrolase family protein, partial [Longimicrobiaceae bacterium]